MRRGLSRVTRADYREQPEDRFFVEEAVRQAKDRVCCSKIRYLAYVTRTPEAL